MESAIREVGKVQTDKNSARARRNSHETIPENHQGKDGCAVWSLWMA